MARPNYKLAKLQQDFKTFYDANLRKKYEQLEPARKKYLGRFWRRTISCTAFILLIVCLCISGVISKQIYDSDGFIKLSISAIFLMFIYCRFPIDDYCVETKSLVMDKILSFWGTFEYSPVLSVSEEDIKESELFPKFNRNDTDDSFEGIYNNTKISVDEKELRVKGDKHDYCVFDGVVILLKFNKKFKGQTVVKNSGSFSAFYRNNKQFLFITLLICGVFAALLMPLCFFANNEFHPKLFFMLIAILGCVVFLCVKFLMRYRKKATQKVNLESIDFSKKWSVFTSNQIEARYILTPIFMEKINDVKKLFHGKDIDFGFFDSKLMIAVHTSKNLFETTSLFTPALDYAKVREVVSQLYSIFAVIDLLQEKA